MTTARHKGWHGSPIALRDRGDRDAPPVLLVHGLAQTLYDWPEALIEAMLHAGLRVIAFDNRDSGGATRYDHLSAPVLRIALSMGLGLPFFGRPPYRLVDMADDLLRLMTTLGISQAHLVGVSMGGMIAQHAAIAAPDRVASLTCLMSSSTAPRLPAPEAAIRKRLLADRAPADLGAAIEQAFSLRLLLAKGPNTSDQVELRSRVEASIRHGWPQGNGAARQLAAILADRDRCTRLSRIRCPTLVIHGSRDPLLPIAHGMDLARRIPGATFVSLAGAGHEILHSAAKGFADRIISHVTGSTPDRHVREETIA
jgi:pimeloyl-ACP methyl ester carboxylesterase